LKSRWDENEARTYGDDELALRVYSSRVLGEDPDLVLHGGGNTSVKGRRTNLFGDEEEILFVKGSGWDLATIEAAGFAPCRLRTLRRLVELEAMADQQMADHLRAAMTNPNSPSPSVESILHAIIPFTFVDHSHSDVVVAISNTPHGHRQLQDLYGDRIAVVPYCMPGFVLARRVWMQLGKQDWSKIDGILLEKHGVFTFADDARESYEQMIALVDRGEDLLRKQGAFVQVPGGPPCVLSIDDLLYLSDLRRHVSQVRGKAQLATFNGSPKAHAFSQRPDAAAISIRGTLTPDHVLRTKRLPLVLDRVAECAPVVNDYATAYKEYFDRHSQPTHTCLDLAPRWALWLGRGVISFGSSFKELQIVDDIVSHTLPAIAWAEKLGGWMPVTEQELFEVEYWDLEQAKLGKPGTVPEHEGKVALVTGAGSGIGKASVEALRRAGAAVAALDLVPTVLQTFKDTSILPLVCDVTDSAQVKEAVEQTIRRFGGLDLLVSNAGVFTHGSGLGEIEDKDWDRSLAVNLTSHRIVLKHALPFLERGLDAAVVFVGSRNVTAPGRGAAAYSAAKAGLTQMARVAALELAPTIRVNIVHPDSVYDTAIWTGDVLKARAKAYGLNVEDYKKRNLLGRAIRSADVAALISSLLGSVFRYTTGAQIPIDGGNDRVI